MPNINELWEDFSGLPYPDGAGGAELQSTYLSTAECVSKYINEGSLSADDAAKLRKCLAHLESDLQTLGGEAYDYFDQLYKLGKATLS